LYSLPLGDFHDITSGTNGGYNAGAGYDLVTGLGTPAANLVVPGLISYNGQFSVPAGETPVHFGPPAPLSGSGGSGGPENAFNVFGVVLGGRHGPTATAGPAGDLSNHLVTEASPVSAASGRGLVIGGAGGGRVQAGGVEDMPIGILASSDTNHEALSAFLPDWQPGASDAVRADPLTGLLGGSPGEGYLLAWGNAVNDEGSPDQLVGATTGLDWFFAQLRGADLDAIANLNKRPKRA
jgi:hypothetical protein